MDKEYITEANSAAAKVCKYEFIKVIEGRVYISEPRNDDLLSDVTINIFTNVKDCQHAAIALSEHKLASIFPSLNESNEWEFFDFVHDEWVTGFKTYQEAVAAACIAV